MLHIADLVYYNNNYYVVEISSMLLWKVPPCMVPVMPLTRRKRATIHLAIDYHSNWLLLPESKNYHNNYWHDIRNHTETFQNRMEPAHMSASTYII